LGCVDGDFEKGDGNGSASSVSLVTALAAAWLQSAETRVISVLAYDSRLAARGPDAPDFAAQYAPGRRYRGGALGVLRAANPTVLPISADRA
jgi:hypothetical protein